MDVAADRRSILDWRNAAFASDVGEKIISVQKFPFSKLSVIIIMQGKRAGNKTVSGHKPESLEKRLQTADSSPSIEKWLRQASSTGDTKPGWFESAL